MSRLQSVKLKKMNDQRESVTNIHHPRYVKGGKCDEPIEWEETVSEFDNKLEKEEEGTNSDNLICNSIDKDYLIGNTLVSLCMTLANLERNVAQIKERCIRLCELTNLETPDL